MKAIKEREKFLALSPMVVHMQSKEVPLEIIQYAIRSAYTICEDPISGKRVIKWESTEQVPHDFFEYAEDDCDDRIKRFHENGIRIAEYVKAGERNLFPGSRGEYVIDRIELAEELLVFGGFTFSNLYGLALAVDVWYQRSGLKSLIIVSESNREKYLRIESGNEVVDMLSQDTFECMSAKEFEQIYQKYGIVVFLTDQVDAYLSKTSKPGYTDMNEKMEALCMRCGPDWSPNDHFQVWIYSEDGYEHVSQYLNWRYGLDEKSQGGEGIDLFR